MKLSELLSKYGDIKVSEKDFKETFDIKDEKYFIPKLDEEYWFVSSNGSVGYNPWEDDRVDKFVYSHQRVFRTEEEAKSEASRQRFLLQMERDFLDNSDELDWVDEGQYKYYLCYDHALKSTLVKRRLAHQNGSLFTTNKEWLEQYIKDNEENILKYYFGIKETRNE